MDLGDDDDDEDDGDGMMEKENKAYEQLEKVLMKCQLCGPTKFCKINRVGEHICLSFQQRRGWAVALVCNLLYLSCIANAKHSGKWGSWCYLAKSTKKRAFP